MKELVKKSRKFREKEDELYFKRLEEGRKALIEILSDHLRVIDRPSRSQE